MENDSIHRRLSFRERGHFTNYPTLRPVRELQFLPQEMRILQCGRSVSVPYGSLAIIRESYIAKGYGRAAYAWLKRTLVSVVAPNGKRYTFDLSGQFPDFKESVAILEVFKTKFNVEIQKETLKQVKRRNLISSISLFAALAVMYMVLSHYGI